MNPTDLLEAYRLRSELTLQQHLPAADTHPHRLHEAMRYAVLGGGKRLRPCLVYAAGSAVGVELALLDARASAVELLHAYSLVHDDLPAMDDDDLRRGRPTCHKAYDEATAILVGDALQALAFGVLAQRDPHPASSTLDALRLLTQAAGSRGLVGGQAIDLAAVGQSLSLVELENMHIHKTGALIRASVLLGATARLDLDPQRRQQIDHYGKCIGLAFQIQDDILDVTGDTATLGKRPGVDLARDKPTYPALLGLDGAREHARSLCSDALDALAGFDAAADTLRSVARYIVDRQH